MASAVVSPGSADSCSRLGIWAFCTVSSWRMRVVRAAHRGLPRRWRRGGSRRRARLRTAPSGRDDRSLNHCLVVLEQPRQDTNMDHPAGRLVNDVDDFGGGWRILVAGG